MMSECKNCGKEYCAINYKNKLCDECHDRALQECIDELKKSWNERHPKD